MEDLRHIHVFRTNIAIENLQHVNKMFASNSAVVHWNVDTEDCDHVLRVVSYELSESQIITMVSQHGYECVDLS